MIIKNGALCTFLMSELLRLHFAVVDRWVTCTYKNFFMMVLNH